jgi:hypothetical protein
MARLSIEKCATTVLETAIRENLNGSWPDIKSKKFAIGVHLLVNTQSSLMFIMPTEILQIVGWQI